MPDIEEMRAALRHLTEAWEAQGASLEDIHAVLDQKAGYYEARIEDADSAEDDDTE